MSEVWSWSYMGIWNSSTQAEQPLLLSTCNTQLMMKSACKIGSHHMVADRHRIIFNLVDLVHVSPFCPSEIEWWSSCKSYTVLKIKMSLWIGIWIRMCYINKNQTTTRTRVRPWIPFRMSCSCLVYLRRNNFVLKAVLPYVQRISPPNMFVS